MTILTDVTIPKYRRHRILTKIAVCNSLTAVLIASGCSQRVHQDIPDRTIDLEISAHYDPYAEYVGVAIELSYNIGGADASVPVIFSLHDEESHTLLSETKTLRAVTSMANGTLQVFDDAVIPTGEYSLHAHVDDSSMSSHIGVLMKPETGTIATIIFGEPEMTPPFECSAGKAPASDI